MEGICLDLAQRGYFAVSVHYQRLENLSNENPLIPWRTALPSWIHSPFEKGGENSPE
jgi:hypothetical protein